MTGTECGFEEGELHRRPLPLPLPLQMQMPPPPTTTTTTTTTKLKKKMASDRSALNEVP
jgi:hypothetical protein